MTPATEFSLSETQRISAIRPGWVANWLIWTVDRDGSIQLASLKYQGFEQMNKMSDGVRFLRNKFKSSSESKKCKEQKAWGPVNDRVNFWKHIVIWKLWPCNISVLANFGNAL